MLATAGMPTTAGMLDMKSTAVGTAAATAETPGISETGKKSATVGSTVAQHQGTAKPMETPVPRKEINISGDPSRLRTQATAKNTATARIQGTPKRQQLAIEGRQTIADVRGSSRTSNSSRGVSYAINIKHTRSIRNKQHQRDATTHVSR
jgi:hypothetical protein